MILAIIFLVLFAIATGVSIYFTVSLIKTPMIEVDYKKFLIKPAIAVAAAVVSFLVASFGFYQWLNASPDAAHIVQLVVGAIFFIGGLLTAINCFILHYYGRNIPEKLDKLFFRIQLSAFIVAFVAFFIYTNGLAPYLSYPLVSGISFKAGLVTPEDSELPNLAFYAICILSGAILVYFLCDHYMYKITGKHGIFESTFFVAFPAGIIGGRIGYDEKQKAWFFYGENNKKFDLSITSEGIKKISILDALLGNHYLSKGSIVIIDEAEANLHPEMIARFMDIVYELAKGGLQFFISSHSYFVIKKLYVMAQKHQISVPTWSFENGTAERFDLLDEMPENAIVNESIRLYKEEIGAV